MGTVPVVGSMLESPMDVLCGSIEVDETCVLGAVVREVDTGDWGSVVAELSDDCD